MSRIVRKAKKWSKSHVTTEEEERRTVATHQVIDIVSFLLNKGDPGHKLARRLYSCLPAGSPPVLEQQQTGPYC